MSSPRQIGTVTLLRDRLYESVSVPAGTYPVLIADGKLYWRMTGWPTEREAPSFESLGDGMFVVSPGYDRITGTEPCEVVSRPFTLEEFRHFITSDPACLDGSSRRLTFDIDTEALR